MDLVTRFPKLARHMRRLQVWGYRAFLGIDPWKVVFSCFMGQQYGDNPRCISERLHERCPQAKIVWLFGGGAMDAFGDRLPDYVTARRAKFSEGYRELATARVWVDNFTKNNLLTKAKGRQFYVQTWHGDRPVKKICYDIGGKQPRRLEEQCDRVVTGSDFAERIYRTAFRYPGKYLSAGIPRNDVLVENDPEKAKRVRKKLGVPEGARLMLYAPTYRDNSMVIPKRAQMDMDRTLDALERRTGEKWLCLLRTHYFSQGIELDISRERIIDVTKHPDMAELLLAADLIISDYSTAATDYILRDRPAIFYVADWEEYTASRPVYFDVHDSPFMLASNQEELEALIEGLTEEKAKENCRAIREFFGCHETGRATDAVCDYIIERLGSRDRRTD